MYAYLPTKAPDYSATTLNIPPDDVVPEEDGGPPVILNRSDSGAIEAVVPAGAKVFVVRLYWDILVPSEAATIWDLYFDPAKGGRGARTIPWEHPLDGHTYVVRMIGTIGRNWRTGSSEIKGVVLNVEGKI